MNFLGLPLFSGVSYGEQEELAVHVGSDFGDGPTFKVSYRPNEEVQNLLVVKAGVGPWLTPRKSFATVSAEVELRNNGDTKIWLKTKPVFGDFSIRRDNDGNKSIVGKKLGKVNGVIANGDSGENGHVIRAGSLSSFNLKRPTWGPQKGDGVWTLKVDSKLPFGKWAFASLRWGMGIPKEIFSGSLGVKDVLKMGLPTLILDKITLEPALVKKQPLKKLAFPRSGPRDLARISEDVTILHAENSNLRKSLEELKQVFAGSSDKQKRGRSPGQADGLKIGQEESLLRSQAVESLLKERGALKDGRGPSGPRKDIFK